MAAIAQATVNVLGNEDLALSTWSWTVVRTIRLDVLAECVANQSSAIDIFKNKPRGQNGEVTPAQKFHESNLLQPAIALSA